MAAGVRLDEKALCEMVWHSIVKSGFAQRFQEWFAGQSHGICGKIDLQFKTFVFRPLRMNKRRHGRLRGKRVRGPRGTAAVYGERWSGAGVSRRKATGRDAGKADSSH